MSGFDPDRLRLQSELTTGNNKSNRGIFHLRVFLKHSFRFAEHRESAAYGVENKVTVRRITNPIELSSVFGEVAERYYKIIFGMFHTKLPVLWSQFAVDVSYF